MSTNNITLRPQHGSKGYFTFKAPFSNVFSDKELLEVTNIAFLEDLIADNLNPFEIIYDKNNIEEGVFKKDLFSKIPIITLTSSSGNKMDVPASFLKSIPRVDGEEYVDRHIFIAIGPHKRNSDTSYVTSELKELIENTLGVVPDIKIQDTSRDELVSHEVSRELEMTRLEKTNSTRNYKIELAEAVVREQALRKKLLEYEKIIKAKVVV